MKGVVGILTLILCAKIVVSDAPKTKSDFQSLKELVLQKVNFAIKEIEHGLKVVLKDPFAITRKFKNKSEKVLAKIRKTIDKCSFNLENELKRILKIDITKASCGVLGRYRELALGVYDEVKECITDHVYSVLDSAEDIYNSTKTLYYSLITTKDDVKNCENLNCLNSILETVTLTLATIPKVTADVIEIGGLVSTLATKLEFCASLGPSSVIMNHYLKALTEVPQCATEKISNTVKSTWKKLSQVLHVK